MENNNDYYRRSYEFEFYRDAKLKNWDVVDSFPNCDLKVGDIVTFTNDYGVSFKGNKVLGFLSKPDNNRCVYLDFDCYWFPVRIDELQKEV